MKTATDIPEIGRTVEKTTVTRVIPSDLSTGERKTPDFWEYTAKLAPLDWERHPKHTLYIYRRNGDVGPMTPLERLNGFFPVAGRDAVPLNDQEELECAMAAKYGGGTYRLVLKKGSERITEGRIMIDGPAKSVRPGILDAAPEANASSPAQNPADPSNDLAKTAMHIVADQPAEGLRLGMSALAAGADIVQRLAAQTAAAPAAAAPADDLTREFMRAMIVKMMNPPDPLDQIKTIIALMSALNTNGGNPMVDKIINGALDRFMNAPAVAPGGTVSTGAALVSQLPQIASYVSEAVKEWRVGSEAQLQTAQIMARQGGPPALPAAPTGLQPALQTGRPITQATQLNPSSIAQPTEAQVMPAGAPSLEFIEQKIVEILKKQIPADDAADEVLAFLDLMAPTMVDQLAACTEAQLVQIFQARPVLRQYHDLARLQEFVRSFLKFANDSGPASGVDSTSKPN